MGGKHKGEVFIQRSITLTFGLLNMSLGHFYPFLELYHGAKAHLSLFK